MDRPRLIEELGAYLPVDPHERRMRDEVIKFVWRWENCASRALPVGHLTGSAWIVDHGLSHALLTHHRRLDLWVQLGGHVENEREMIAASLREAREESGLDDITASGMGIFDLDIHEIPERPGEPRHLHYDIRYLFFADRGKDLTVSDESRALAWVELERVVELTREESVLRMVRKTLDLRERGEGASQEI